MILHHFLEALFAALRKFRIVSTMQFCQSMSFAVDFAEPVVVVAAGGGEHHHRLRRGLPGFGDRRRCCGPAGRSPTSPRPAMHVPHREFWPPLVRFAIWIWFTNLLCNLFAVVDRYMLVHWSGLDATTALAQVGHYHSSRIVPLLLISLADLLAGVVMPYLSHDWERGQRRQVSDRLNLVLKLTSLGMLAASVLVLWAAPLLFHVAFRGQVRRRPGRAAVDADVLRLVRAVDRRPELHLVRGENEARLAAAGVGLVLNIVLNLVLLPTWGLFGRGRSRRRSRPASRWPCCIGSTTARAWSCTAGLFWLSAAPAALCGGVWLARHGGAVALVVAAPFSRDAVHGRRTRRCWPNSSAGNSD